MTLHDIALILRYVVNEGIVTPADIDDILSMVTEFPCWHTIEQSQILLVRELLTSLASQLWRNMLSNFFICLIELSRLLHSPNLKNHIFAAGRKVLATVAKFSDPDGIRMGVGNLLNAVQVKGTSHFSGC